jgi:hypothetical protein
MQTQKSNRDDSGSWLLAWLQWTMPLTVLATLSSWEISQLVDESGGI